MAVTKTPDGRYKVDIRPAGVSGSRIIRVRNTRKEAKALEAELLLEYQSCPSKFQRDHRRLSDLVKLWHKLHGATLKDEKYRLERTLSICTLLGDPPVHSFTASDFARYRIKRLESLSVSTVNHETRYLRSVFNELIRLGQFNSVNPLIGIKTFREPKNELSFLDDPDVLALLASCEDSRNTHCAPVVRLCLATGARWSEANDLPAECLKDDRVVFLDTKNGDNRSVPIAPELALYLRSEGFPVKRGRLFDGAKGAFRTAVKRSGIELPAGQLTHVLRHTFASHFLMNGGNILTLQKVLGHSDLKVTMRYAHLAPDYMRQVVDLCPLNVDTKWKDIKKG